MYLEMLLCKICSQAGHAMEWKENFGMEHGKCSEWNGRSSSILTTYTVLMKTYLRIIKYYQTRIRIITPFSVLCSESFWHVVTVLSFCVKHQHTGYVSVHMHVLNCVYLLCFFAM